MATQRLIGALLFGLVKHTSTILVGGKHGSRYRLRTLQCRAKRSERILPVWAASEDHVWRQSDYAATLLTGIRFSPLIRMRRKYSPRFRRTRNLNAGNM